MTFHGGSSEAVIDTGRPDRENLLIIGDSFAHAIFKLRASHFNRTHLIDPRRNDMSVGQLADYIRDNEINKVLFRMMFTPHATQWLDMFASEISITRSYLFIPLGLICSLPLRKLFRSAKTALGELAYSGALAVILGICVMYTVSSNYNPFIYFRF